MQNMPGMSGQDSSQSMTSMPGMKMSDMGDMGPSMAAMAGHMYITPTWTLQPGDEERAKSVVDQVRTSIEKYKDYKKALADGYAIANPDVDQPQFHFTSDANSKYADQHFDPTRPTSLLYRKSKGQKYKLEGVMFTAPIDASAKELNSRIPLSVVHWHLHINFCGAPANRIKEYLGAHPKFGMFGSINTEAACKAEGGTFLPSVFTWMIHVFPYEADLKSQFSMNDDIAHNPEDRKGH